MTSALNSTLTSTRASPNGAARRCVAISPILLVLLFGALLSGCPSTTGGDGDGDGDGDPNPDPAPTMEPDMGPEWEPARTDRTTALGSNNTFDVATWNIEAFPKTADTPEFIADMIRSMDLDLVAVQEITSVAGFDELVGRLPDHEGVLTSHTYGNGSYQKVGFIYKSEIEVRDVTEIFGGNWFAFPRPPLEARVIVGGGTEAERELRVIVVHLKASSQPESAERRTEAFVVLDGYLSLLDEDVILLGDFNEVVTNASGLNVFGPLASKDSEYTIWSEPLANQGQASFIPSGVMLDHIITTSSLDDEVGNREAIVPALDDEFITYVGLASDHLPVVLSLGL